MELVSWGSPWATVADEVLGERSQRMVMTESKFGGKAALACLQGPWGFCLSHSGGESMYECGNQPWHDGAQLFPSVGAPGLCSSGILSLHLIFSALIRDVCVLPLPPPPIHSLHFQINFKSNLFNIELFLISIVTSS